MVLLVLLVIGLAIVGALLWQFDVATEPDEAQLGASRADAAATLYIQTLGIDPVNDSIQIRVDSLHPQPRARDAIVTLVSRRQTDQIRVSGPRAGAGLTLSLDLDDGSVRTYPLDAYTAEISLSGVGSDAAGALPLHVTVWSGLFGYEVHSDAGVNAETGAMLLRFSIRRTGAVRFFGLAVFAIMVVLAACSLTIGALVFVGVRKIEVTLFSALGAIIFALPVLRNTVPGTPPLGIQADVLVFFWAECGAVTGLCLFLLAWVSRGAKP